MRQDKLTTKFQEALADAQSIAVGSDHQYIEPIHVLAAMLRQSDGAARSLLQRAGANVAPMTQAVDGARQQGAQKQKRGGLENDGNRDAGHQMDVLKRHSGMASLPAALRRRYD